MKSDTARTKKLNIRMTENELEAIKCAAEKRGMSASTFGAQMLLGCVLKDRFRTEQEVIDKLDHFYKLFCRTMERSLAKRDIPSEMFASWMKDYPEAK